MVDVSCVPNTGPGVASCNAGMASGICGHKAKIDKMPWPAGLSVAWLRYFFIYALSLFIKIVVVGGTHVIVQLFPG